MRLIYSKRNIIIVVVILFVIISTLLIVINSYKVVRSIPPVSEKITPLFSQTVIGKSVEGRSINAYTYGNGPTHLAFIGGIHGGYEWNSVLLAYKLIEYLKANPLSVPKNITVTVIPSANPDGVYKVTGKDGPFTIGDVSTTTDQSIGRFNADKVDLNRNFDCKWQPKSTWKGNVVDAGKSAFSEPETQAIKNFIINDKLNAVVFFHSQSNAVYASQCDNGILPKTTAIMNIYAKATGYPAVDVFDSYVVTGAAEDWLASINIPAISVELKTHETIEWDKNLLGIRALFSYFSK